MTAAGVITITASGATAGDSDGESSDDDDTLLSDLVAQAVAGRCGNKKSTKPRMKKRVTFVGCVKRAAAGKGPSKAPKRAALRRRRRR